MARLGWQAMHLRRSVFFYTIPVVVFVVFASKTMSRCVFVFCVHVLLLHSVSGLRVATRTQGKPWNEAVEEARDILAKDCGDECLRILNTVVGPLVNGTVEPREKVCRNLHLQSKFATHEFMSAVSVPFFYVCVRAPWPSSFMQTRACSKSNTHAS
jgi:hypothetical protein